MALTIDDLEIRIQTEATKATGGIEALTQSLTELKNVVSASSNLTNNLTNIANAFKGLSSVGKINLDANINQLKKLQEIIPLFTSGQASRFSNNIGLIGMGLGKLANVPKTDVGSIANSLKRLDEATKIFDDTRLEKFSNAMQGISVGLSHLSSVEKGGIGSVVNSLKKIPEITEKLDNTTLERFAETIKRLTNIMAPLAQEMAQIGYGFSLLPRHVTKANKAMESAVTATKKANEAHKGTLLSLSQIVNQYTRLSHAIDRVVDKCADFFNESNEYIESLNLFKVTMGEASDEALRYAESVSAAMGIDPAEWIKNQGVFQRQATGFGVVSEEAEIMSRNLTQLAYDLSSFFNTDVQTAMEKLQSGMTGQIKGLKAWGYNLSVAALQETALNLGIKESVRNMTEAQKAQLRYITLIQKSNGIMGDMAKTINTPSNAMRIMQAQITQFKRALGNLVSIIATKVIPYIQAFVELMTEAAQSLAESWGFEIKELPTNNLEMGAEVIEGIGDSVEDTTDEVSKLKKQLLGFDELNILGSSKDEEDTTGTSNSLNIDLPEYDFLSNLDNETRERIDAIKESIKELFPVLKTLGEIFLAVFAVKTFVKAKNAIMHFFTETKAGISIVQLLTLSFGDFFALAKQNGVLKTLGSSFKSLWSNFKGLMSSLPKFTKGLVSIVAVAIEFNVVKDAVYDFVKGNKSLGETLMALIPVCTAVGVALYAMLGPFGLVITAVTAIIGAISGACTALDELEDKIANDALYDDFGFTISELADDFSKLMNESTACYDVIFENQDTILNAKKNISDAKTEFDQLIFEVETGATTIEDALPRIESAFQNLYENTKMALMGTAALVYASLTGSTIEGVDKYMRAVSRVTGATIEEIDKSQKRLEEAKANLEAGTISKEAYYEIYVEEFKKTSEWTTASSSFEKDIADTQASYSDLMDKLVEGINWNSNNLEGELQKFENEAINAKTKIEEAYRSLYDSIGDLKHQAKLQGDTEALGAFDALLAEYEAFEKADLSRIDNQLNGVIFALQEDLVKRMDKVFVNAGQEWDDMWLGKIFYSSEADFKSDVFKKFLEELKEGPMAVMEEVFGSDKMLMYNYETRFYETLFGMSTPKGEGPTNASKILESYFKTDSSYIVSGLVNGLTDEQKKAYDAARELGKSVLEAYNEALGIHSPSVEMEERGEYTIQGLVKGLSNTKLLDVAIDNIVEKFDILSPIQSLWKKVTDWWKNISIPGIDLLGGIGAKVASLKIGKYASDGFPTMGQMFIARESGPELVGRIGNKNAVANNDQITAGIFSAVYSAMMAAQEDGKSGNGGNARIILQIDGRAVGEASVNFINGQIIQTGTNPILT